MIFSDYALTAKKTTVKSTAKPTKTTGEPAGPSSTKCPVPLYYQCGGYWDGEPWTGCEVCVPGANCVWQNGEFDLSKDLSANRLLTGEDYYMQCVADV